jgi:hypothetical protein
MVWISFMGRQLRITQAALVDAAFGEMPQRKAHAAHVQRFQRDRLEALADHELGGTAADIHHQLLLDGDWAGCGRRPRKSGAPPPDRQ